MTSELAQHVGRLIYSWRFSFDPYIRQSDLAKRVGASGSELVSNWERGAQLPSPAYRRALLTETGIDVDGLVEADNDLPASHDAEELRLRALEREVADLRQRVRVTERSAETLAEIREVLASAAQAASLAQLVAALAAPLSDEGETPQDQSA